MGKSYKVDLTVLDQKITEMKQLLDTFPEKMMEVPDFSEYKGDWHSWLKSLCEEVLEAQNQAIALIKATYTYLEQVKTTIEREDQKSATEIKANQ